MRSCWQRFAGNPIVEFDYVGNMDGASAAGNTMLTSHTHKPRVIQDLGYGRPYGYVRSPTERYRDITDAERPDDLVWAVVRKVLFSQIVLIIIQK